MAKKSRGKAQCPGAQEMSPLPSKADIRVCKDHSRPLRGRARLSLFGKPTARMRTGFQCVAAAVGRSINSHAAAPSERPCVPAASSNFAAIRHQTDDPDADDCRDSDKVGEQASKATHQNHSSSANPDISASFAVATNSSDTVTGVTFAANGRLTPQAGFSSPVAATQRTLTNSLTG